MFTPLKALLMENPEMHAQSLQTYLKIILNLPRYMHNYAERMRLTVVTPLLDQVSAERQ